MPRLYSFDIHYSEKVGTVDVDVDSRGDTHSPEAAAMEMIVQHDLDGTYKFSLPANEFETIDYTIKRKKKVS